MGYAATAVATAIVAGRLAGFARDALIVAIFGANDEAAALVLLLALPDLALNLVIGGAVAAVLIPEFATRQNDALKLFWQTGLLLGAVFGALSLMLASAPGAVANLLAPGLETEARWKFIHALPIVVAAVPFSAFAALTAAWLNSRDRFIGPACGTLVFTAMTILALLLAPFTSSPVAIVATGILLGAIFRFVAQALEAATHGLAWSPLGTWLISGRLLRFFVASAGTGILLALLPTMARAVASFDGSRGVVSFSLALKLVELPLAIVPSTLIGVCYPRLSRVLDGTHSLEQVTALVNAVARLLLIVVVAVTAPALAFVADLTQLAFDWGKMDDPAINEVTRVTQIGLVSLPLQSVFLLASALFTIRKRAHIPLLALVLTIPAFLFWTFVLPDVMGAAGAMAALVGVHITAAFILVAALSRWDGLDFVRSLLGWRPLATIALAIAVSGISSWLARSAALGVVTNAILALLCSGTILVGGLHLNREAWDLVRSRSTQ